MSKITEFLKHLISNTKGSTILKKNLKKAISVKSAGSVLKNTDVIALISFSVFFAGGLHDVID